MVLTARYCLITVLISCSQLCFADWFSQMALEFRHFPNNALDVKQHDDNVSFMFVPEYNREWQSGDRSFTFKAFMRYDQGDDERTHGDIRELNFIWVKPDIEWQVGISKVYWGVTESAHLVDIINQSDLVENIDGEDKLGQPMIKLSWAKTFGNIDLFILPGFRERTFPGQNGRLRSIPHVDTDSVSYESSQEARHVDFALRYSTEFEIAGFDAFDMAISQFSGTNRDPHFNAAVKNSQIVLVPFYDQIMQTGLELQATYGDWLFKNEMIYRDSETEHFWASVTGFEYTYVGVMGGQKDLGVLLEYLYDNRGTQASSPFQNDLFLGFRLTFNDEDSTDLLFGVIDDQDTSTIVYNLESSTRLSNNFKLVLEARFYENINNQSALFSFHKDDYIQAELFWYLN